MKEGRKGGARWEGEQGGEGKRFGKVELGGENGMEMRKVAGGRRRDEVWGKMRVKAR